MIIIQKSGREVKPFRAEREKNFMENKTLNVAIIGMHMGTKHLVGVRECGDHIGAVCDINPTTLKHFADMYEIPECDRYLDYRDILKREDIDVAIVAAPDQLHLEMSEAFLAAGKHVLCEKPLALTREELVAICEMTKKYDRKFMVGQICRYSPNFAKAKELVDAGAIGELYYVESEYAHDYHKIMYDWRCDPNRHGVVGGGCHAVDLLRWIAGDPYEVFAYGTHKLLPMVDFDDATISVLKFPNGVVGKIFVSTGCKRPYTMRTLLYGTKGTIICEGKKQVELYTLGEDGIAVNPTPEIIDVEPRDHNTYGEFMTFRACILEDAPLEMTAEQGARTIAACLAIVESAKTGVPVKPNYEF